MQLNARTVLLVHMHRNIYMHNHMHMHRDMNIHNTPKHAVVHAFESKPSQARPTPPQFSPHFCSHSSNCTWLPASARLRYQRLPATCVHALLAARKLCIETCYVDT